ncbi:MAG: HEAT repeat domain-containing protein [Flavobacteriales bacterium]|nr:HEAT repeat domain-containing protein [Flavobacteriales bacterium]
MSDAAPKKSKLDLAFAALLSDDDAQVLTALARVEEQGDARAIRPLLTALAKSRDAKVQQRITDMLYQIKVKDAVPELMAALDEPTLLDVRRTVLATFWNAGLDVRDHLERFVDLAVEGDAEECFECFTVIENQEIWPEKAARLGLAKARKAATAETDAYKGAMLNDLVTVLEERLGVE